MAGLRLAGEFYAGVVRPLLDEEFPALRYAAALLGPGSEVLGFDTGRSVDHDWGPRLQVFLDDTDASARAGAIAAMLARRLPAAFAATRSRSRLPANRTARPGTGYRSPAWAAGCAGSSASTRGLG